MGHLSVYLNVRGELSGPFAPEELSALWRGGEISDDALFWYEGMEAWLPIASFQAPPDVLHIQPDLIVLTTAEQVAGREVLEERQIVGAETIIGVDWLEDLLANITDVTGSRSKGLEGDLRAARAVCLRELRIEAARNAADAVIAVRLQHSELSGKGRSMLLVAATGTAVKLRPQPPPLR